MALTLGSLTSTTLTKLDTEVKTFDIEGKVKDKAKDKVIEEKNKLIDKLKKPDKKNVKKSKVPEACLKSKTTGAGAKKNKMVKKKKEPTCSPIITKEKVKEVLKDKKEIKKEKLDDISEKTANKLNSNKVSAKNKSVIANKDKKDCEKDKDGFSGFDFPSLPNFTPPDIAFPDINTPDWDLSMPDFDFGNGSSSDFNLPSFGMGSLLSSAENGLSSLTRFNMNMDWGFGSGTSDDTACDDSFTATLGTMNLANAMPDFNVGKGLMDGLKMSGKFDLGVASKLSGVMPDIGDKLGGVGDVIGDAVRDIPTDKLNLSNVGSNLRSGAILDEVKKAKSIDDITKNKKIMDAVKKDTMIGTDINKETDMFTSQKIKALSGVAGDKLKLVA